MEDVDSPDKSRFARVENGKVAIFDAKQKQQKQFLAAAGAVAWQPDGKALAVADARGIIRVWM